MDTPELIKIIKNISELSEQSISLCDSKDNINSLQNSTFNADVDVDLIVQVSNRNQISELLKLANENDFIVHPVSSAKNWGYGSVSRSDGRKLVVLDLSNLTAIKEIDKSLGLIAVEPGVTQHMLREYLDKNNWPYMVPVTGAGPTCSILSNALERGYGITAYTDHFAAVTSLKGFLPHPDLCEKEYCSAVASLDDSKSQVIDHTFKWGLGPYLDGLFTQSNMAVITEATIRLAQIPEAFSSFYVRCFDAKSLPKAVEFIKNTLRDFEGSVVAINLMDKRRVLSMMAENPNGADAHQVMSDEQLEKLSKQYDVPEWTIVGSIAGQPDVVKAVKKSIKKRASFGDQILFSDSLLLKIAKFVSSRFSFGPLPMIRKALGSLDEASEIMLGTPNQVALPLAYWRNPVVTPDKSKTLHPANDECGLLWYAPLVHMNADEIKKYVDFIRTTTPKFGIEPLITFTNLRYDCIDSTVPIIFNRNNEEAVAKAKACLQELYTIGREQGFVPYRMNIEQQGQLEASHIHWQTVGLIKEQLDPNLVLCPNHYNPAHTKK